VCRLLSEDTEKMKEKRVVNVMETAYGEVASKSVREALFELSEDY